MRSPSPISPNAADVFAHSLPSIPSHFEPNESFDPPQPPFSDLIPANNSSTESIAVAVSATPPRPASADPDKSSRKMMMRERSEGGRGIIGGSVGAGDTARRVKVAKKKKVTIEDFELLRVLGRGCAGKVRPSLRSPHFITCING
jgi:serum/glucocorticoid-regulated kinase 2